jgi:lipoprotein NlpD
MVDVNMCCIKNKKPRASLRALFAAIRHLSAYRQKLSLLQKERVMTAIGIVCFSCLALTACTTTEAPVVEGWKQSPAESSDYRVQPDDTVYSIAWAFNIDYRELAQLNHLKEPYQLTPGQTLRMSSAAPKATPLSVTPLPKATPPSVAAPAKSPIADTSWDKPMATGAWIWPTKGQIIRGYSPVSGGNKGVDISGVFAQAIVATATGKVVYTGASLPGYGNLIIIKHSESELSAYAFNKVIAVKEGQVVKAGQVIAQMGKADNGKAMLHFEVRKGGKPVDPMRYLKR